MDKEDNHTIAPIKQAQHNYLLIISSISTMGVTKEKTLQQSDGCDQLNNNVGRIISGDIVTIRYKGWYIDKKKKNKRKEFDDMFHSEKKIHFTVDKKDTPNVFRGLHDAVKLLVLGEKARFRITSDYGFGNKE